MAENSKLTENRDDIAILPKKKPRGRPFQKGNNANPGGRPKIPEDIKQAFKDLTPQAINTLTEIMNDPNAKQSDRLRASEIILDRGYGKPSQELQVETSNIPQVLFVGKVED